MLHNFFGLCQHSRVIKNFLLTITLFQDRLVVKCVNMAGSTLHEDEDDPLGPWRKMGLAIRKWIGDRLGFLCSIRQIDRSRCCQRGGCKMSKPTAQRPEQVSSVEIRQWIHADSIHVKKVNALAERLVHHGPAIKHFIVGRSGFILGVGVRFCTQTEQLFSDFELNFSW